MDVNRAQQILQSPDKIEVQYQGKPIWIDGVDENTQSARIHEENNPGQTMVVPLNQLVEKA
jgi:small acid-soluble spore protein H (minor)